MSIEQLMIAFIMIEMFQVLFILIQIIKTRQELNNLISDPEYAGAIFSNAIHHFIGELNTDAEKQASFMGVIQWMGQNIMAGATGTVNGQPSKPVKLKGMARILEPFINSPQLHSMVMEKVGSGMANAGKKGVERAGEAAVDSLFG